MTDLAPYDIFKFSVAATPEQIGNAYLRLSRHVHFDAGGFDALLRQVKWACDTLSTDPRTPSFPEKYMGPSFFIVWWQMRAHSPESTATDVPTVPIRYAHQSIGGDELVPAGDRLPDNSFQ